MILIVEDDILIAEHLRMILDREGYTECIIANTYANALIALEKNEIRLTLLDINLGDKNNGFDFAKILNSREIPFFFISAQSDPLSQEKIIESKPSGFILKPFKPVQVTTVVKLFFRQLQNNTIKLDDGKNKHIIALQKICYIQANRNYAEINYECERIVIRKTLTEIENVLPIEQFVRCHRSFIVNTKKIESFNLKELTIGEKLIPVSQKYRSRFNAI